MLLSYGTVVLLAAWSMLFTKCCCTSSNHYLEALSGLVKCIWLYIALIVCGVMYIFGVRQTGLQEVWERMWPFVYLTAVQLYATCAACRPKSPLRV